MAAIDFVAYVKCEKFPDRNELIEFLAK